MGFLFKLSNPKILLFLLGVFVVLGLGGIYFYYQVYLPQGEQPPTGEETPPSGTPPPSIAPETDPTVGWKTYTNSEYGFELKHPSDWNFGIKDSDFDSTPRAGAKIRSYWFWAPDATLDLDAIVPVKEGTILAIFPEGEFDHDYGLYGTGWQTARTQITVGAKPAAKIQSKYNGTTKIIRIIFDDFYSFRIEFYVDASGETSDLDTLDLVLATLNL